VASPERDAGERALGRAETQEGEGKREKKEKRKIIR